MKIKNDMKKGPQTKEMILKTALDSTSKLGLEGLSIGELAKKVGMSKSGLFGHFNSKEKLQQMVIDYAAENFTANVIRPATKLPRGIPRIEGIFNNWKKWSHTFFTGGCPFVSAAFEYDDRPGIVREQIKKHQTRMIESFQHAAEIAVKEGQFKSNLDTKQFAFDFYSIMLGFHLFNRLLQDPNTESFHQRSFQNLIESAKSTSI